jgi:transglutaminase superfamily protein/transglutaminase TgpA-like protein
MLRTFVLCAGPAALLAWNWLRLGHPHTDARTAVWLIVLAVIPALLPRTRWRLLALSATSVIALHTALGVWATHPGRLLGRFGGGFLEFYDAKLPFGVATHPRMEGVILVALFVSCAGVALAVSARRSVLAALAVLVAAGWPATLLTGPDDLSRGVVLLAVMLSLLVGLAEDVRPRRVVLAAVAGAAVVLAAFAASTSSAIASGQVLHWQGWDFYTKPEKPVGVEFVWNSDYRGLHFPKKVTVVLRIKAPEKPTYWRATTLDEFDGGNWYEYAPPVTATRANDRDELLDDRQLPSQARRRSRWVEQEVTVEGLRDNHLIGASVPVAYDAGSHAPEYGAGGIAYLQGDPLGRGDRYTVWSYQAQPTPHELARLQAHYPRAVTAKDLFVAPGNVVPLFGAPGRERKMEELFERSYRAGAYRELYRQARRVVGEPGTPYAAALELEGWFRSGAFLYDETPPQPAGMPALVAFVTQTRSGYCQHFAGAMALMLRYLGIPARVAAGFTSGSYDRKAGEWTVTDHDAHTWVEAWFPRYGWLPFDPTPGRGSLQGPYTTSSPHFDLSDGLSAVALKLKRQGAFDLKSLRKLRGAANRSAKAGARAEQRKHSDSSGSGLGALLQLLVLVGAALVAVVVAVKLALRKQRYLTRDPRRLAAACVRELTDFVADQGARAPPSSTLHELAKLVEDEIGVSARDFVAAAAEARFGPVAGAREAARTARNELRTLRRELRQALTRPERALGLVSLRSLGLTG